MAYTDIWVESKWNTSPTAYWTIKYECQRDGTDMKYRFYWRVWLQYDDAWYNNALQLKLFIDGVEYDIDVKGTTSGTWDKEGYAPSKTGWYTVLNKTSGSTSFYAQLYDTATKKIKTTSKTFYLTVEGAASALGAISDFNIGSDIPIKITKYNSSFKDNLEIFYGATSFITIKNITNGTILKSSDYDWGFFYRKNTSSNSGTIIFRITTLDSNDKEIGTSEQTATATIMDADPIYTDDQISYWDGNDNVAEIIGNPPAIVQGKSKLIVNRGEATGQKNATITKYSYVLNGISYGTLEGNPIDFGYINAKQDFDIEITAIDSRGNTTTAKKTITVYPYIEPVIAPHSNHGTIICERCDEEGNLAKDGECLKVVVKGQWYTLPNDKNTASVDIKYTSLDFESDWIPLSSSETVKGGGAENNYLAWYDINVVPEGVALDKHKTYKVVIRCIDRFGTAPDIPFKISTKDTCLHLGKYGNKAAFGMYAQKENAVEINPDWEFYVKDMTLSEYIKEVINKT